MLDSCWESRDWGPIRQQARFILSITLPDYLALLVKVGERWRKVEKGSAMCGTSSSCG
ncbi:hypothetical protein L207DRAFT_515972 [Hyaloscypha variabilis F]|uniref:Uncharacterized protein n=1 Tax=Hyaloscypha variabilis (strain UAMH 11265 / GT02V1 / F) TaxID=1149755 RepID=A0A2J6RCM6_HYAVF|nr:hypothetical protein L207DRAFT_515972 [Hyaloscypha variabilis F]